MTDQILKLHVDGQNQISMSPSLVTIYNSRLDSPLTSPTADWPSSGGQTGLNSTVVFSSTTD